jgi:transposase
MTDVFGVKGRIWLSDQCRLLPIDERQTIDACLRQIDFVDQEIALVDIEIAKQVLASEDIRRLMTLPGVSEVTATAMMPRSVMSAGFRLPSIWLAISA